jgi:hypothetical protein
VRTDIDAAEVAIREAWSTVGAPDLSGVPATEFWDDRTARVFTGRAPLDVDITSGEFSTAEPLLDLPDAAAAAYLAPFLLALLQDLAFQLRFGMFTEIITRAHTISTLADEQFQEHVVRRELSPAAQRAVAQTVAVMLAHAEALAITPANRVGLARLLDLGESSHMET